MEEQAKDPAPDQVLRIRGDEYGETWKLVGRILATIGPVRLSKLLSTPYAHCWDQILGKLIRALWSPWKRDHWLDIIGYATLVLNDIDGGSSEKDISSQ